MKLPAGHLQPPKGIKVLLNHQGQSTTFSSSAQWVGRGPELPDARHGPVRNTLDLLFHLTLTSPVAQGDQGGGTGSFCRWPQGGQPPRDSSNESKEPVWTAWWGDGCAPGSMRLRPGRG